MVDVIIPAYNAHDTIGRTLDSIVQLVNKKDIKVYIINDGSEFDYSEIINRYCEELEIKQISIDNSGPGFARQIGLEHSDSEYIYFLDADDFFYDEYSLVYLLSIIENYDVAQGNFIEKSADGEKVISPQYCYLHGKLYRRSIINKNKIKFDIRKKKSGDIYEDSSFNQLYFFCCNDVVTTEKIIDVYSYNSHSLTKASIDSAANLHNFVESMNWLTHEVRKRKKEKDVGIAWYYCVMCFHCYFHYLSSPETNDFIFKDIKTIKGIYKMHEKDVSFEDQLSIYKSFDFPVIPTITFYDFLDRCEG